jgi:hypothetical protein
LALGWVNITPAGPTGTVHWVKTATPRAYDRYYNGGFTNDLDVVSSPYVAPATGTRVIPLGSGVGNGLVTLDYAPLLSTVLSNQCVLQTNNTFICATNHGVKFTQVVTKRGANNGYVQGSFSNSVLGGVTCDFSGMVLQNANAAYGFMIPAGDTNSSGEFQLQAR